MKTLQMDWLHLDLEGETGDRCQDTGRTIREAVFQLQQQCRTLLLEGKVYDSILAHLIRKAACPVARC